MASVSLPSLREIYSKCHLSALFFLNFVFLFWIHYYCAFIYWKQTPIRPDKERNIQSSKHIFEKDLDCIILNTWFNGFWIMLLMIFILLWCLPSDQSTCLQSALHLIKRQLKVQLRSLLNTRTTKSSGTWITWHVSPLFSIKSPISERNNYGCVEINVY